MYFPLRGNSWEDQSPQSIACEMRDLSFLWTATDGEPVSSFLGRLCYSILEIVFKRSKQEMFVYDEPLHPTAATTITPFEGCLIEREFVGEAVEKE